MTESSTSKRALPRILCVDDEPRVLEGLESHLAMHYEVSLATSAVEGLRALASMTEPVAVVFSDMRMPEVNGAEFLSKVKEGWPETTRILLTGQGSLQSAIDAINRGQIFRFLSKPCDSEILLAMAQEGVRQHELLRGERELLQNTLNGAVGVMTEVMSLTTPSAFSRSSHIKGYVEHLCRRMRIEDSWQYTLAASLTHLGCITLPPDTLDKLYSQDELSKEEIEMLHNHPEVAKRLLQRIPRLENVAKMIAWQHKPRQWSGSIPPLSADDAAALGSQMLAVALAIEDQVSAGNTVGQAVRHLSSAKQINQKMLIHMLGHQPLEESQQKRRVFVHGLTRHMVLDENLVDKSGNVLVARGRQLSAPLLERIQHFASGRVGVKEPIRVRTNGMARGGEG